MILIQFKKWFLSLFLALLLCCLAVFLGQSVAKWLPWVPREFPFWFGSNRNKRASLPAFSQKLLSLIQIELDWIMCSFWNRQWSEKELQCPDGCRPDRTGWGWTLTSPRASGWPLLPPESWCSFFKKKLLVHLFSGEWLHYLWGIDTS